MAKRLITKTRVARLSSYPWPEGVENKDLAKANLMELYLAAHARHERVSNLQRDHWREEDYIRDNQNQHLLFALTERVDEEGHVPREFDFIQTESALVESATIDTLFPPLTDRRTQVEWLNALAPNCFKVYYDPIEDHFEFWYASPCSLLALKPIMNQLATSWNDPPAMADTYKEFVYTMEPEWVDKFLPGLDHDEQAAVIEESDEDVLACVWTEDHDFQLYSSKEKTWPFRTVLTSDG